MKKYFNTSGPNRTQEHYTLMRAELVEKGKDYVERDRYFTIWAPRQTGKSTYFLLLKKSLEKEAYRVIHINVENYKEATLAGLFRELRFELKQKDLNPPIFKTFNDFVFFVQNLKKEKYVLIIDEIEGLNSNLFGQFLHSIRNLYHSRDKHGLKSVILVGVSNIVGVVEDYASPFNIADNLNVPFFTNRETQELLTQHEVATGQKFVSKVIAKISEITANQPGLVNGFAQQLIERFEDKKEISFENYIEVENWYISEAIDKNVSNIVNKAQKYRSFVEKLLFLGAKIPFFIDRPAIKLLFVNGIIDKDKRGNVKFKVPLYQKKLYYAFYPYLNGENVRIRRELWTPDYFDADHTLNFKTLIDHYKEYVFRRGFSYFRERDPNDKTKYLSLKEAAVVYSFETYIQAFLQECGGRSYLEAHTGLGRMDLFLFIKNKIYILEFKIYGGPSKFEKGKRQLAYYCKKEALNKGTYIVFIPNNIRLPKIIVENVEKVDGIEVTTYLIMYDEDKDF